MSTPFFGLGWFSGGHQAASTRGSCQIPWFTLPSFETLPECEGHIRHHPYACHLQMAVPILKYQDGRLVLDKAGRVVLPKPLRDELQLAPGDDLQQDTMKPPAWVSL